MKQIIGIACVDKNGFYATKSDAPLPWPHTEGDLDWFKYITKGSILVVGDATYNQLMKLPPLKNREIWPVGKDHELKSVEDVLRKYDGETRPLFIGGGKRLWTEFQPHMNYFYYTVLKKSYIEDGLIWGMNSVQGAYLPVVETDHYNIYQF